MAAMRKYSIPAVAVAAVVTTPMVAHAITVDFSLTGGSGGKVSGYLVFANPDGQQTPTDVTVTSAPTPLPAPHDFFAFGHGSRGAFTLSHGVVKAAFYFVYNVTTINNYNTVVATALNLNKSNGSDFYAMTSFSFKNSILRTHRTSTRNGFAGLTFTTVDVPEPSTIVLLGAGLAGISMFRRRRPHVSTPRCCASSP